MTDYLMVTKNNKSIRPFSKAKPLKGVVLNDYNSSGLYIYIDGKIKNENLVFVYLGIIYTLSPVSFVKHLIEISECMNVNKNLKLTFYFSAGYDEYKHLIFPIKATNKDICTSQYLNIKGTLNRTYVGFESFYKCTLNESQLNTKYLIKLFMKIVSLLMSSK